jgi:hypothetical protein
MHLTLPLSLGNQNKMLVTYRYLVKTSERDMRDIVFMGFFVYNFRNTVSSNIHVFDARDTVPLRFPNAMFVTLFL